MQARTWWGIIVFLLIVIIALLLVLIFTPAPVHAPVVATSTPEQAQPQPPDNTPLHERVVVSMPVSGATVGKTFTVIGEAPGNWYFEASFPVQVRDVDNNKIGQGIAQAQSDWMTTAQVPFRTVITTSGYSGSATLVLLKDNPSGLPENEDSVSIPITIQ